MKIPLVEHLVVVWERPEEAVAWELFTPMHRILIVAAVAVAAINYFKNREICQLKKSVQLRYQVLASMQQKLDFLCNQVNYLKIRLKLQQIGLLSRCEQHKRKSYEPMANIILTTKVHEVPEERRTSDLSDWNSCATT